MWTPFKPIVIRRDTKRDIIRISSRPEGFYFIFFTACLIGLCSLPFSSYRHDYFAYIGLLFVLGLTLVYFVGNVQGIVFENKTRVRVRKGFQSWTIPFDVVTGGFTSYEKYVSRSSLETTHYLKFELNVDLPKNPKQWIRNGSANLLFFGFDHWGTHQRELWDQFNAILDEKGIPNFTPD